MNKLNRVLKCIISLSMVVMLITITKVNAVDEEQLIEDELEIAIISGDGSADNPYVVDYDKAPNFEKYMEDINKQVMLSFQESENSGNVSTFGIFDGVLKGTKHTGQTKGGTWKYTSGAPSVVYNGNIWMKAVTYQSISDTKALYEIRSNQTKWDRIDAIGSSIAQKPYTDAYNLIVSSGIAGTAATSLLRCLGKVNGVFTAVTVLKFINDYMVLSRYKSAVQNGDGMIHAVYNTSYNGSWYSQQAEDTWTSANTVYEPSTAYGKGTYTANK